MVGQTRVVGEVEIEQRIHFGDFLDLLDAERVLFQVRLTYHRLLADHWKALAELERALGRSFPGEREESGAVR